VYRISTGRALTMGLLAVALLSRYSPVKAETGLQTVNEYIDLVASGNYESATGYWTEESQRRSRRFGIEYIDISLKIDCSSPLIRNPGLTLDYTRRPVGGGTALTLDDYRRYTFEVTVGKDSLRHYYYTLHRDGFYWLIPGQDYHSHGWPVKRTKYLNIHYHPELETYLSPVILDETDKFIEHAAESIGLSDEDLRLVEKEKLEYFYCESENMVKDITGFSITGTHDLATDDIISAFFPHYHEITHFLINLRLRRLPLYTQPLLREGIAVLYGGRWGKGPAVLLALGGYIYGEKIVDLDSILTMTGFEVSAGSDMAYPLAGLLAAYVSDRKSTGTLFELYRELSGSFEKVAGMTADDVRSVIVQKVGVADWEQLRTDFDKYLNDWMSKNAGIYPGRLDKGEVVFETSGLVVTREDNWVGLEVTFPPGATPSGNLVFGYDSTLTQLASSLFEDQYRQGAEFEGYRYGVRFDQNEAGLYDYATSHLLAKYIWGIAPSDSYYSEAENKLTLKFDTRLTDNKSPSQDDFKMLGQ
jgi:hypothetical protein